MINDYIDLGLSDPIEKAYLASNSLDALNNLDSIVELDNNPMNNFKSTVDYVLDWYPKYLSTNANNKTLKVTGSLIDVLNREGVHFRVTSGYRPNARTRLGRVSNHSKQNGAYDITPAKGYSWNDLKREIYGNKNIVNWMNSNGWGIIDETVASTKAMTGATGDHWHFGPDTLARKQWLLNLARYGLAGMKFLDALTGPSDLGSSEYNDDDFKSKYLEYLEYLDDQMQYPDIKTIEEEEYTNNPLATIKYPVNTTKSITSNHKGAIPDLIHKMIPDKLKADILTNIAYKESGFNIKAKNPVSTASGLFQLTNANKRLYGYGDTPEALIQAASRFYDANLQKINSLVNLYGNRGKSLQLLMYAFWFNPKGAETYIKTGKDVVTDKQGTTMTLVLARLS